jgi:hypothetical protein
VPVYSNENIALFHKRAGDLLNIKELKSAHLYYADFLVNQVENKNIIKVKDDGYLITDYFSPNQEINTHVLLNHALGEMRFLLQCYAETDNEEYFKIAWKIRRGIESLGEEWIKDNGDVWYQVNSDFQYSGNDYPLLTLEDLLLSQLEWQKLGVSRSKVFDQFIKSKTTYLVNQNIPIRTTISEELIRQDFKRLIDGYENITKY